MDRGAILERARELTYGDRNRQHGGVWENFGFIADTISGALKDILTRPLKRSEAALIMTLMKMARTRQGSHNMDDYVDGAAYTAIAGELADRENATPETVPV